tara:strand:+ start:1135 stop:1674 length:540 start_codon:yes stop_codon:yes gene_type:complete
MGNFKRTLGQAAMSIALKELFIPVVNQLPDLIGTSLVSNLEVEFFALCKANPKASFCCVRKSKEQEILSGDDLFVVMARFGRDNCGGMKIRPSSTSLQTPIEKEWLSNKNEVIIENTSHSSGIELISFHNKKDGLQYLGAKNHLAAQTAAAELAQKFPLWQELRSRIGTLGHSFSQSFS